LLARIEGAPAGTKGISLFVVPKKRLEVDGSLHPNDVVTAGDYQKMGQKGYCTTHLVFGEQDDCRAWLVGEPNYGLKYMFQMMNGARIAVGRGAVAIAAAAYHASLQYAQERPQGRKLTKDGKKDLSTDPVLIMQHPDVRRMLLLQKAIYEGSLSLVLETARFHDLEQLTEGAEKEKYHLLLELLTPIAKTYPSEKGREAIDNGLQVLGGYGFCSDFVLQQYYRDIRIFAIYEGTTGIQSLDLLGRKITMHKGAALKLLAEEIQQTIGAALTHEELKPYAKILGEQLQLSQEVLNFLMPFAMKGNYERFLSDATIFMEFFGTIVVAWQWLKMATQAKQALVTGQTKYGESFYESNIHTMKFFFKYEVPKTKGLAHILMNDEVLTIFEQKELIS
jgi:LysM repeat protein